LKSEDTLLSLESGSSKHCSLFLLHQEELEVEKEEDEEEEEEERKEGKDAEGSDTVFINGSTSNTPQHVSPSTPERQRSVSQGKNGEADDEEVRGSVSPSESVSSEKQTSSGRESVASKDSKMDDDQIPMPEGEDEEPAGRRSKAK